MAVSISVVMLCRVLNDVLRAVLSISQAMIPSTRDAAALQRSSTVINFAVVEYVLLCDECLVICAYCLCADLLI